MKPWVSAAIFLLTPILWIVFITACLIFWIYRRIIHVTLRILLGTDYGGLLNFTDGFTVYKDKSRCIICTVLVFKSDHEIDLLNYVRKCLQEKVIDVPEDYPKMSGTLHTYGGYAYWIKNDAKLDQCVKTFPVPQNGTYDEDYVKTIAGDLYNTPLPQDDKATWEFNVCEKPIITKSGEEHIFRYPLILRLHHVIGDGTTVFSFLTRLFGQRDFKNYGEDIFQNRDSTISPEKYFWQSLKKIIAFGQMTLYMVFLLFQKRLELIHWRKKDVNALHGADMSGDKFFVWKAEDDVEFVPIVKRIKNAAREIKFSHVVYTAITASFANYFKKNSHTIPDIISTFPTMLLKYPKVDPTKPVPLENKSTAALLELPVKATANLGKTLLKVKQSADRISYFEAQSNLLFLHYIFALFPINIRTLCHDAGSYTAILSNVPGGSVTKIMDGCYIEKVMACAPNIRNIGVCLCVLTYDDRFQIGLLVDKNLMSSQEVAQEFVDDIFKNFKLIQNTLKL